MKWEYKVIDIDRGYEYSKEIIETQLNDEKHASWELVSMGSHLNVHGYQKIWAVFKRAKHSDELL